MFRWPIQVTPLSLASRGGPQATVLEVTPRGAVFTLAALAHVGHPAHLAVIDAYLKGQMRVSTATGIGEDSRLVLSAVAAPLVAAHELGIQRFSLQDLILLPPVLSPLTDSLPCSTDSARFLLRGPEGWRWVRATERFEPAGCLGTRQPGQGSRWHDAIVQVPERPSPEQTGGQLSSLPPIDAEVRAPTEVIPASDTQIDALRSLALARFARSGGRIRAAVERALSADGHDQVATSPLTAAELRQEARSWRAADELPAARDPAALAAALAGPRASRAAVDASLQYQGTAIPVSLTPDLDGYQTLCLLPPDDVAPAAAFELMRAAAWDTIEALMGRPLAEYRTEAIALRLVGAGGRTTTLDVGVSVVIVRNQTVFAGWVGADGRMMLKLFPPDGMPGAAAAPPPA